MTVNSLGQPVGEPVNGWTACPAPQRDELRGAFVTAQPVGPEHTAGLFAGLCGPDNQALWTYRPTAMPGSVTEFESMLNATQASHRDSVTYAFLRDGHPQGLASLYPTAPAAGVAEIAGVLFGTDMQRTRASTEALHLLLRHLFDDLGYRRVEWKCDSLNEPSRRAALRLGFTFEGHFRKHRIVHGLNRDTDWYSIVDDEWPAVRTRHERWLHPANFDGAGTQRNRLADS